MSVDKFGRQFFTVDGGGGGGRVTGAGGLGAKGPPGEGFKLTKRGDYDITNKLLTNVGNPETDVDAVNYITLKRNVEPCLRLDAKRVKYDASDRVISGVARPINDNDVVTLSYVKDKCVVYGDVIDMKKKIIQNVHDPVMSTDVASKGYVDALTLSMDGNINYNFNAKSRSIKNLGEPTVGSDAVTKNYVDTNVLMKDTTGYRNFNAKKKVIKNLGNPSLPNDAVNKQYVDSRTLTISDGDGPYDANNRGIMKLSGPVQMDDAVNMRYVENKCLQIDYDTVRKAQVWDAKGSTMKNLWYPQYTADAVNVSYLMEVLGKLIHYIYLNMSPIGDDIRSMTKEEWIRRNIDEMFFSDIKKSV